MCSTTRGPAIAPSFVTWPITKTEISFCLANCTMRPTHSRNWATEPGADGNSAAVIVWIESTTSTFVSVRFASASTLPNDVSASTCKLSPDKPSRRARWLTWRRDSSPVAYRTAIPPSNLLLICCSSVDLPTPGSPPSSTTAPGTSPPPKTLSNSPKPVATRSTGSSCSSASPCASAPPPALWVALEICVAESVFQDEHSGHCPAHLTL